MSASTLTRQRRQPLAERRTVAAVIPVDRIDRNPTQPRKVFTDSQLDEQAMSMLKLGQLQPISVTYDRSTRRYTLLMGERRWRAAQRTADPQWRAAHDVDDRPAITHLQAVVEHGLADADVLPRQIAENTSRVSMTPMEEAEGFKRLADDGWEYPEIADVSGKSVEYVGFRIDLLGLIEPAQAALNAGHLPVGTSWYVAKLSPAGQQRFLTKYVRGEFPSIRDAEAFAQAVRNAEQNEQSGLFDAAEMSDEQRERIARERKRLTTKVDRLAAAGEVLAELASTPPDELAVILAGLPGGVGAYRMRAEHIRDAASKAVSTLRKAGAIAAAATPDSPAASADTLI